MTGWQIKRYVPDLLEARIGLIKSLQPDIIVDGGANRGQWSREVRKWDSDTPILAFEPIPESFEVLQGLRLRNIQFEQAALSDTNGTATMNVSGPIGMQSSIGEATGKFRSKYPTITVSRTQEVRSLTLDSLDQLKNKRVYLKLDVEGFEWQVLQGARSLLSRPEGIIALEIETSVSVLRAGERTHYEIVPWLESLGFQVFHLFTPGVARNGKIDSIDCILTRVY